MHKIKVKVFYVHCTLKNLQTQWAGKDEGYLGYFIIGNYGKLLCFAYNKCLLIYSLCNPSEEDPEGALEIFTQENR